MRAQAGHVTTANSTGNQAFDIDFDPTALLLQWIGVAADSFAIHSRWTYGIGVGGPTRATVGYRSDHGVGTTDASRTRSNSLILQQLDATTRSYDLISLNADGFTLNFNVAPGVTGIPYLALADDGGDLQAAMVTTNLATGGATQDITGFGFTPDAVLFIWAHKSGGTYAAVGAGVTTDTAEACMTIFQNDLQLTSVTTRGFWSDRCIAFDTNGSGSDRAYASFNSFISDGVRLNLDDLPGDSTFTVYALGLEGVPMKAGVDTVRTTTGTKSLSFPGVTPAGAIFVSSAQTADGFENDDAVMSIGVSDGTSNEVMGVCETHGVTTTEADRYYGDDKSVLVLTPAGTPSIAVAADVSFASEEAVLNFTTVDGTAYKFFYLLLGNSGLPFVPQVMMI